MAGDNRNGGGAARAGEVIEASTGEFTAECYRNADPPPLGSLVTTRDGEIEIFGVVFHAAATGLDRSRPVAALGEDADTEAELRARHPELAELLRAEFSAIVVGYRGAGGVSHVLPPRPARLHGFVHLADPGAVREFTRSPHFLANLVSAAPPEADHAAAAFVRLARRAHPDPAAFQLTAGKELARLLARDVQRLNTLLRMIQG